MCWTCTIMCQELEEFSGGYRYGCDQKHLFASKHFFQCVDCEVKYADHPDLPSLHTDNCAGCSFCTLLNGRFVYKSTDGKINVEVANVYGITVKNRRIFLLIRNCELTKWQTAEFDRAFCALVNITDQPQLPFANWAVFEYKQPKMKTRGDKDKKGDEGENLILFEQDEIEGISVHEVNVPFCQALVLM